MYYAPSAARLRPKRTALLLALPLCLALAGCGGGGGGGGGSTAVAPTPAPLPTPVPTPTPVPVVTSASAPALSNFTATLREDRATVPVNGTVNYTLSLTNTSSNTATVIVDVQNGQTVPKAALFVTNPAGATVYPVVHPGAHDNLPPAPPVLILSATLAPGQSLAAVTRPVSVFAAAGTYQAVATFSVAYAVADPVQTVTLPPLPVVAQ